MLGFVPLFFLVPLFAWAAFIVTQYRSGDRPVDKGWLVLMLAIGLVENGKGIYATATPESSLYIAGAFVAMLAFAGVGFIRCHI